MKGQHLETENHLSSMKYKNLIIAFTSQSEWNNTFMDKETLRFIERSKLSENIKNPLR